MKLNISPEHFLELQKRGYSLDFIFLLRMVNDALDVDALCKESVKVDVMRTTLIRKGLLTETGDKLTILGQELLVFMETKIVKKIQRRKLEDDKFEQWWKAFPGTNSFTYKGRHFPGDRGMRVKKEDCRLKLDAILLEGEYSLEDMINALQLEVKSKMEASIKANVNKLSYMHNSLTYLTQRDFEPFIELYKAQEQTPTITSIGGTDI